MRTERQAGTEEKGTKLGRLRHGEQQSWVGQGQRRETPGQRQRGVAVVPKAAVLSAYRAPALLCNFSVLAALSRYSEADCRASRQGFKPQLSPGPSCMTLGWSRSLPGPHLHLGANMTSVPAGLCLHWRWLHRCVLCSVLALVDFM